MQKSINDNQIKNTNIGKIRIEYTNGQVTEIVPKIHKPSNEMTFSVSAYTKKGKCKSYDVFVEQAFMDWFREVITFESVDLDQEFERIQEKYR